MHDALIIPKNCIYKLRVNLLGLDSKLEQFEYNILVKDQKLQSSVQRIIWPRTVMPQIKEED